jgi:hypothetical protein
LLVVDGWEEPLKALAKDQGAQRLTLHYPDPERREKQLKAYKINPARASLHAYELYGPEPQTEGD